MVPDVETLQVRRPTCKSKLSSGFFYRCPLQPRLHRRIPSPSEGEPFCADERNAALGPAMCFEWIYMTSRRVAMSLFARVRAYVRALPPACGQRFPAAADVGPSSRVPLRDTKLAMIIPYLTAEGRTVSSCWIPRRRGSTWWRNGPDPGYPTMDLPFTDFRCFSLVSVFVTTDIEFVSTVSGP